MSKEATTRHVELLAWIDEVQKLVQPEAVHWCDGSEQENERLIQQMLESGRGYAVESPLGWMPRHEDLPWAGLDLSKETFYELMRISRERMASEARSHEELFDKFLDRLPKEFVFERELFKNRLWRSPDVWALASERETN